MQLANFGNSDSTAAQRLTEPQGVTLNSKLLVSQTGKRSVDKIDFADHYSWSRLHFSWKIVDFDGKTWREN